MGHVGREEGLVLALVEEGIDMAHRVEARLLEGDAVLHQLVAGLAVGVAVDPGVRSARPAEEGVDRHAQRLALDVPERDVDRRDGAVDRRALEVAEAVHEVPVALDRPRVLAHEMAGEGLDGGARGREMPPGAGFA